MSEQSFRVRVEDLQPPISKRHMTQMYNLLGELTTRSLTREQVEENIEHIAESLDQHQVVALHAGNIVGMATLTTKIIPSERTGYVDDVVVARKHRGKGIARALMHDIIERADDEQLTLQLTSASHRPAALALYLSLGFNKKDTNYMLRKPRHESTRS